MKMFISEDGKLFPGLSSLFALGSVRRRTGRTKRLADDGVI